MNVFKEIGKGLKWTGEEIAKVFVDLPKALNRLITLSSDAKEIASSAADEVIAVSADVGSLVAAVAKDDGASLKAIELLLTSASAAIADKGLNYLEDTAVIQAVESFFASISGTNYADVLAAIAKVIEAGKSMTSVVLEDFKKLQADVG